MRLNIFDFDLTCTNQHTFRTMSANPDKEDHLIFSQDQYELGKSRFESLKKSNLHEYILHDDTENCSAIATFHNNPSFIAGFFAAYFGREIVWKDTNCSENSCIAAAQCSIEGINRPFIISYIPEVGARYQLALPIIENKNIQIQNILLNNLNNSLPFETYFYDDDPKNVKAAGEFIDVKTLLVDRKNSTIFSATELVSESRKALEKLSLLRTEIINTPWNIGMILNLFTTGFGGQIRIIDGEKKRLPHHAALMLDYIDTILNPKASSFGSHLDEADISASFEEIKKLADTALRVMKFGRSPQVKKFYETIDSKLTNKTVLDDGLLLK